MANTFDAIVNQIFARGLLALRQHAIMPRLINTDWSTEVAKQGDTVNVPVPSAVIVGDVTPGPTPPAGGNSTPSSVAIVLDRWKKSDMFVTDKEAREVAVGARDLQLSEHLKALANYVDAEILALYKGVYGYAGTAGTTPFAGGGTPDLAEAVAVDRVLNDQLAPTEPRNMVLGTAAKANALLVRAVQDASFRRAGEDTLSSAMIGDLLGFMWAMDQNIPTHTAGTITTGLVAKASTAVAAGTKSFAATTAASTGACALKEGDIINIAGHSQTYVLTADATQASAATDVTLAIEPGLEIALAGSEAITVKSSHVANLGFHRDAFALATRTLGPADGFMGGNVMRAAVDPISGLTLTLEVSREYARTKYQWRILYGVKLVRRELACRLAG